MDSVRFCNYTIGTDAYAEVPAVCRPYGSRALLIGGVKSMAAAKPQLETVLEDAGIVLADSVVYGTDCTFANIHRWADYAKDLQVDMIFGMGGGKALDTAKGTAHELDLPIFTFPTIASTCAATTKLSVVYREDGSFECFDLLPRPAIHSFINTTVIAAAPDCYLRAGMGDTLGKFFECHFAARGDALSHSAALGREISNLCYLPLLEHGVQALADCRKGLASPALEQVVLANIINTGLVSLLVPDQYNGAVAHSVYYGLVLLPGFEERWLHGDVVAYGVLVQLALDGDWTEFRRLKDFLTQLGTPTTLAQMGVPVTREYLRKVLPAMIHGKDMEHIPYPITEDMVFVAMQETEQKGFE